MSLALGCKPTDGSRRLVVGMELSYPPFEMTDEQGRPAGVSVDLARALSEHLGRELVIENIAFDGLIPALKTGKIDVILSSLTRTEERALSIDFSDPYLETGLCLLVSKASPINTVADLDQPGRKFAVKKGTTGHAYASAHLQKAEVLVLDKEAAAVLEVVQGKVDAFIYDQFSTLQHWQRNAETTRAILKPFQTEQWAMGLRKGNDDLHTSINGFLSDFRKQGGFDRLADRWLKEQKAAFTRQNLPFVF
ncbi:MAG: transporter substrate-binding domain-containing protein [Verrucomicrobiales bacterium]|nr:transporter substrate-binding domain-containing protein [Verrucomicrobiales bacterium]